MPASKLKTLSDHVGAAHEVVFSPDGKLMATVDDSGKVYLWDVANPASPKLSQTMNAFGSRVTRLAFNPDGQTLVVGGGDGRVHLLDISNPAAPQTIKTAQEHAGSVFCVVFSPDGKTMVTAESSGNSSARSNGDIVVWRLDGSA